jgi:hypothetical protein
MLWNEMQFEILSNARINERLQEAEHARLVRLAKASRASESNRSNRQPVPHPSAPRPSLAGQVS